MEEEVYQTKPKKKRSVGARIARGFAIFLLSIVGLLILILLLIQTAPVQNFARKKIVAFLENKLKTDVAIGRLDIDFPKMLVLEDVYFEDQSKDTLLAGGALKVDIDMLKLLQSKIQINEINLSEITLKVKRQLPDTTFNFQYILDAFATQPTTPNPADTAALQLAIDKIIVDKTRLVYKDVVTGNDVDIYLNHFDTRITTLDPTKMVFTVPTIRLDGVRGTIRQTKPLDVVVVKTDPDSTVVNEPPQFLKFSNNEILLSNFDINYSNAVSAMQGKIQLGELNIYPKDINMEQSSIVINKIEVNELAGALQMGRAQQPAEVITLTNDQNQDVAAVIPWKVQVGSIEINNNRFKYDDNTMPATARGMDFAHLNITGLDLHLQDFRFNNDSISGSITRGEMQEKRGFNLQQLQTDFTYTNQGVALNNLLIKTPGTEIKRSAVIRYPSLAAIQNNPGLMELNIDINNSRIQVRDILTFMPDLAAQPAFSNPNSTVFVNTRLTGSVSRLNIHHFQFRGLKQTNINLSGTLYGLPDPNAVSANLNIRAFNTGRADIQSLAPAGTIPPNITIPERLSLTGYVRGNAQQAYTDLSLGTTLGNARVKGTISNATDPAGARYDATIATTNLDVGTLIQNPQVGRLSANLAVKGRGFDPETVRAQISGNVTSAQVMQYNYRNLQLDATIANQQLTANAAIRDPNIHLSLQANADISGDLPGFDIVADIDSIKTQPLNLTPDAIVYRGKIEANFPELNLDALNGSAFVTNSVLVMNGQRMVLDTISLQAYHQNNEQTIALNTGFASAVLQGQYKLEQLGNIMIEAIQPYYTINTGAPVYVDPYDFTLRARVYDHPAIRGFVPTLTGLDSVAINGRFSSVDGWNAQVNMPLLEMGTNRVEGVTLNAATGPAGLLITSNIDQITSGANIALFQTGLNATINNNQVDFGLKIRDRSASNKYQLGGLFAQNADNSFSLKLKSDSLLLNYQPWSISPENLLVFGANIIRANNFALSHSNQVLSINSTTAANNSPLDVRFNNFRLATLTGFVQADTLLVDGTLNGNVLLSNLLATPNFQTDLTINNLAVKNDTIGDVNARINNNVADVFNTNITITGQGNDVSLTGNYYMAPTDNNNLDFTLAIRRLNLSTLEGASMGSLRSASGYLDGNLKITGATDAPKALGNVGFNNVVFDVAMLNSQFKINQETIRLDNDGIKFDTFTILDSANNSLVIDGAAYTSNFTNYRFDMNVRARDFRAINSTKLDNPLYYGQLYFNSNINISGTETLPVVDGTFRVNENTNLSIVLPQTEPGIVAREGVIEFVDMDAPGNDSIFLQTLATYDSTFNKSDITGFDISANIEIVKEAVFNVIVDEGNGDFLKIQGEGLLNGGIDPSGKVTLTGSYEIESGGYELSFNMLRRRFDMEKGGRIVFTGDPTTADVNVTAIYVANTSPIDLVGDQLTGTTRNLYLQKMPFNVRLTVTGELMQPTLSFDIVLPEDNNLRVSNEVVNTVNVRLDQLKQEPSELNKQVFALLLLNRFVGQNPFESAGGGGGFNAALYAKQSVSKILTQQLNNLAADLITGVDVSFDLNSSEDYSTGESRTRTDFNVALSKRLLNDRLKVTVGNNFELEGPKTASTAQGSTALGNIAVDYNLTKDGRYLIRAYRRNEYDAILEGYVIENGLKFIISVDYNRFKEIFEQRKQRRRVREMNRENKDELEKAKETNNPSDSTGVSFLIKSPADIRQTYSASDKASTDDDEN